MEMSKLLIIHKINDENDRPALERWFNRYHAPEVMTQAPWAVKYVMYRPVPCPPGAENYGYYGYRVHESWVPDQSLRRGERGLLAMTKQPGACDAIIINMPAEPTEDFLGREASYDDHTILRWVCAFRYPDGVPIEEGEGWFLTIHVPEVMDQPKLTRFFSTKAYINPQRSILPQGEDFLEHDDLFYKQWHRVSELWYECNNDWYESVIKNPPPYTKPGWATHNSYPFLIPGSEFISTFLLETPERDFLKEIKPLYL
jgi:hypothetical protein